MKQVPAEYADRFLLTVLLLTASRLTVSPLNL
jgi:hypothetical protein